jgi:hypothetical protein
MASVCPRTRTTRPRTGRTRHKGLGSLAFRQYAYGLLTLRRIGRRHLRVIATAVVPGVCAVVIDDASPEWPYQQVAAQIRQRVQSGELGPRLPSYMTLAHELGVAPMTVQRAIKVLKDEGLLVTYPGRGTYVRKDGEAPRQP